jgi:hypothetical protein
MQERAKRKLLDIMSTDSMTEWEDDAFRDMYRRDTYRPYVLSYSQVNRINIAHDRIFKGVAHSDVTYLPDHIGEFKVIKHGNEHYIRANDVTIPEPVSSKFGREIIQYLYQAHQSGVLPTFVKNLSKTKKGAKKNQEAMEQRHKPRVPPKTLQTMELDNVEEPDPF